MRRAKKVDPDDDDEDNDEQNDNEKNNFEQTNSDKAPTLGQLSFN